MVCILNMPVSVSELKYHILEETVKKLILLIIGLVFVLTAGAGLAQKSGESELNRAIIRIDSLSCGGCFSTINAGLVTLEGFSGMGANLFRKLIAVDFADPLTPEKISEKLAEVGYPGTLEEVEPVSEKESFAYLQSRNRSYGAGGGCCSGGAPPSAGSSPSPVGGSCCTLPQPGKTAPSGNQPTQDL